MHDVRSRVRELREQLSHTKKIGCFFGAGTSMAMKLPGIVELTNVVLEKIDYEKDKALAIFEHIKQHSKNGNGATVEELLNYIRMIRQITYEKNDVEHLGVKGSDAVKLDQNICKAIHEILSSKEDEITELDDGIKAMQKFIAWYNWSGQGFSKEIFTLNYDLIIEKSMESLQIPFFDGFIGAYEPFFHTESVENIDHENKLPNSWTRLWKLHGSLGWYWKKGKHHSRVVRLGAQKPSEALDELVIYPSKDKYESSRKQPFLTYLDRLRNYLRDGESIFIISGYSFADDHINEVIFNGLRQNHRLHAVTFIYDDENFKKISGFAERLPNLALYGPNSAVIGGIHGEWTEHDKTFSSTYWSDRDGKMVFTLGDFNKLGDFLLEISGRKNEIEADIEKGIEQSIDNPLSGKEGTAS